MIRAHVGTAEGTGSAGTGLLGRERERELVASLLAGLPGGGGLLHLSGAPGTGKSTVLRLAAAEAVGQGIRVLSTAWAPGEEELPYAALHGLLRPVLAHAGDLPDRERAVLRAAFTGGGTVPDPPETAAAGLRLLAALSEPVLLCVDDLDRLDAASRDALLVLAGFCGSAPAGSGSVGMIVAERAGGGSWSSYPNGAAVALGPLPDVHARALVARAGRVGGYGEEQLVLAVAGGNPLALTELSLGGSPVGDTAGFGMLPATPRLAEAYAYDWATLAASARCVLLTAALSTSPCTPDILAASASLLGDDGAARAGLAELVARGLVVEAVDEGAEGSRVLFREPLLRAAAVRLASAARRMAVHAALGRSLGSPVHAAWHAAQCVAGPDEDLAERLERLAAGSRSVTGVLVALAALEGAARLSADPEQRAVRLLRAAELACDHGLVDQALRQVGQIDPTESGTLGRALLLRVHDLLPGSSAAGRERVVELCEAARAVAGQDAALPQKLLLAAARRCRWQQVGSRERDLVLRTAKELRAGPRDGWYLVVLSLIDPLSVPRPPVPQPVPRPSDVEGRSLFSQVTTLTVDFERAEPLLEEVEAAFRATGRYGQLPLMLVPRTMCQIWLGTQWHKALALAEESRVIAERTAQSDWAARATGMLAIVAALRGEHDRATECAAEVEESSLRVGQDRQLSLAVLARALTAAGTGRYAEAYARLRSLFADPRTPYAFEQFWGLAFLAEAALPAGEQADARTVAAQVASLTRAGCSPLLERIVAYADAVLAPDEEAEERHRHVLRPGIEVSPLLHGMAQFGYGAWLRRRRRVTESRAPLAAAESVFRTLGAPSRAEQAASELRATGWAADGPSGEDDVDGIAHLLSPQQLTIARLAARGLSNRAIGEQLRLSPRTVSSHLYQIFPKLGVSSRAQLAAKFGAD
ncbi:helix-turn-helix transcriptional regulator [Streptomyces justiciae]|uniref:helix-turn-helix transcriptional regulator n=1 Tax=Streptomyces justiciae TaxID=2780140 RepID=UPI002117422B|nr:LuxR family transcriptional regulator [Streptomyces justiciae]MCW8383868.1 AAA family ATPase [Streptomyces justiciae]